MAWICGHASGLELRLLVICLLLLLVFSLEVQKASAQQQYNNVSGYACTGASRTCQSYAYYRTQGSQATLSSLALIFNTSEAGIANASGIESPASPLQDATPLYIPLSCGCVGGTVYQAPTSHVVASGETMYIIANQTYQGMTTYEAIEAANPAVVPENMAVGQVLNIPLRCACPSAVQRTAGSTILLSYAIFPSETLSLISGRFNVSVQELQDANNVTDPSTLQAFSTLLIPLATLSPLAVTVPPPPQPPTGPSPPPTGPSPTSLVPVVASKDPSNTPLYIGIAVGTAGLAVALLLACLLCMTHRHYKKIIDDFENDQTRSLVKPSVVVSDSAPGSALSSSFMVGMSAVMGSDKPTKFSYEEVLNATNLFSDQNRIQGSVFMGKLNGSFVAIKQMKGNMSNELKILSQVHHGNVVQLVGMCASSAENLYLVFEYAENGSLSDCLHYQMAYPSCGFSRSVGLLSWKLRVQIALDVASGLEYLHNYTNPSLVHKDVKSSNILLDGSFRAKVANFGMAKWSSAEPKNNSNGPIMMTKHIVGTQGYMAPEYLEHGLVTTKADVFSFGVVLLELLSGREAVFSNAAGELSPLSATIFDVLQPEEDSMPKLQAWMDSRLQDAYPRDVAYSAAKLAMSCVHMDPALRPDMKECNFALSKMCQASQEWDSARRYTSATIQAR